jgi:hypoxanthine-guanine phosphoribosyltransferase
VTRAGCQAICAAVVMLLCKDTMDTGLTLGDRRQTRQASHPESLQVCTRLHRPVTCRGVGMPDRYVVGDSMDDSQHSRSWPCMGMLKPAVLRAHGKR